VPLGRRCRENGEGLRRAVFVGWKRQAVAPFEFTAIAFVTDDGVLAAELRIALQIGAFENPVLRAVHFECPAAIHNHLVAEMKSAVEKTHAGELVLGTLQQMMPPQGRK
jgi:hypothetical protein